MQDLNLCRIPASSRLLVGVAGIPASGKTSLARRVVQETNNILAAESRLDTLCAICVSQDGWHLSRSQLDAHSDPKLAHERRGIHWTFDADGYVDFVRQLRGQSPIVYAPSFDHAAKVRDSLTLTSLKSSPLGPSTRGHTNRASTSHYSH